MSPNLPQSPAPSPQPQLLIGLVGGIASGKSLVAEQMKSLGGVVLDADRAGHEVLRDKEVIDALHKRWGDGIITLDGSLSRSVIAKIVFSAGNQEEKRYLESVTHPRIAARLEEQISRHRAAGNNVLILDAALLFEAGWDKQCDVIIFVSAPREIRLVRALARGWSERDFLAREATQLPLDEKRARSGYIIDNSGPADQTRHQVGEWWRLNVGKTDH
ncbi:MAG: dephospho-CoA kinase [Pirellulaceae bacterium]